MELQTASLYDDVDREEAARRLPEVNDIKDDEVREQVLGVLTEMPDYFWTAPAASRHHPREHRQRHGLWLHTKRVATTFERLSTSMVKQGHLSWGDIDLGRAACLLHDMFKYGIPPTSIDSTSSSHDVVAAEWIRSNADLPSEVADCVEAHNGPWYSGSNPTSHLQQTVHIADMQASDENVRVAVKDPHPVLKEQFPRVNER